MSGRRRKTRRGMRAGLVAALTTAAAVAAVVLAGAAVVLGIGNAIGGAANAAGADRPQASVAPICPETAAVTVGTIVVPRGPVAGFCQDQLVNAAQIIRAARSLGIGTRTQTVGVMTAIGESHLRNLDYGDVAGPDSRGIFQQRDNGAWGTLAERMDPYTAALHFFQKAIRVPGWQTMAPTELAHAVQGNAEAGYYAQYWPEAEQVVAALGS